MASYEGTGKHILIFAGTKSGRELAHTLADRGFYVTVSSATVYGAGLVGEHERIQCVHGKMDLSNLMSFVIETKPDYIIDATHPYAAAISRNVIKICETLEIKLIRYERKEAISHETGLHFEDMSAACAYLSSCEGEILFTTGVNEIPATVKVLSPERIHVRIIPVESSMVIVRACGLMAEKVVAKKPPFTLEENLSYIQANNIRYLVTKDSGADGNTAEKVKAALMTGVKLIVIDRPKLVYDQVCYDTDEIFLMLCIDQGKNLQKVADIS